MLTLTYFTPCTRVSIVKFEHVMVDWVSVNRTFANKSHVQSWQQSFSDERLYNVHLLLLVVTLQRGSSISTGSAFPCSKSTMETLEQYVKYVEGEQ